MPDDQRPVSSRKAGRQEAFFSRRAVGVRNRSRKWISEHGARLVERHAVLGKVWQHVSPHATRYEQHPPARISSNIMKTPPLRRLSVTHRVAGGNRKCVPPFLADAGEEGKGKAAHFATRLP